MRALFAVLVAGAALAAPASQTFTGVITDSECANGVHSAMQMGPTDAECAAACVDAHGATYVLYDGKNAYGLSDQVASARLAGRKVRVTGALEAGSRKIHVESIAALSP